MASGFDQDTLEAWDTTLEVDIETSRGSGAPVHQTIIWIVRDGDDAFVRSVRGTAGRWYREIVANPHGAVHAGGTRVAVHAEPATDPDSVARVSRALQAKYGEGSPDSTARMVRDEVLSTTLRLEPDQG